jgi:hypothetical protein
MALRDRISRALKPSNSTPTRQNTGTGYVAKGAPGVSDPGAKPAQLTELGSQRAGVIVDPVPALGTPSQALRTYTAMVRDDVSVRISLRAGKAPVLGADWYIDPFSSDEQDMVIAEFVDFNLFGGMTTPWTKTLEQILKMFEYGFSCFEPVWELREWAPRKNATGANRKQYTMLRKMAVRPASTISKFNYDDNGGPVSVDHKALDADGQTKDVTIPIEKLIIFTFDQDGGNLQGNSILRSAYRNWYYKDHLYKIDGIQKERHGIGVPDIELQPGYNENDKTFAHELGRNLRTNERAYIVRTTNMKVSFAELKGNLVEPLRSAEHHDTMIMKNIMVQFLNMGTGVEGGSGGRATGATSMDMFLKSMRHIADSICDSINLYLIPNLVAYNFPTDRFPQLRVRNVGETKDLQMWSAAMRNLINADAIQVDDETEQWIRQQMDMPRRTSEFIPQTLRPTQVMETGNPADYQAARNGKASDRSNNGGAGNLGASPNSGST